MQEQTEQITYTNNEHENIRHKKVMYCNGFEEKKAPEFKTILILFSISEHLKLGLDHGWTVPEDRHLPSNF